MNAPLQFNCMYTAPSSPTDLDKHNDLKPGAAFSTVFTCLLMWKVLEHALLAMISLSSSFSPLLNHSHTDGFGSLQTGELW